MMSTYVKNNLKTVCEKIVSTGVAATPKKYYLVKKLVSIGVSWVPTACLSKIHSKHKLVT